MKKIIVIALAVISVTVYAQNNSPAPAGGNLTTDQRGKGHPDANQRATKLTEFMTKKLLLTEVQKKQVFSINLDKAKKIEALHAEKGKEKKALGAQRKAIEQERDAEFKRVLSTEQYDKWMKLKTEKKKDKKEKHEKGKDKSGKVKNENDNEDDNDGDVVDQMGRD